MHNETFNKFLTKSQELEFDKVMKAWFFLFEDYAFMIASEWRLHSTGSIYYIN